MERHYAAGEMILRRDEISPFLMQIRTGKVRLETTTRSWYLSDGDFFGEESIFLRKPATYTAFASEETILDLLTESEAASFLAGNPAAALIAIQRNIARLHEPAPPLTTDNPFYLRLLRTLLPYTRRGGERETFSPIPLGLTDLATLLETTPEAIKCFLTGASAFGDIRLDNDDTLSVREAEHLRMRISATRNAAYFFSGSTQRQGRGHYNLLSRIDVKQEGKS